MSNVLPKETLEVEWSRFRNRCVLVGGLVFLGTAVFSGVALLPAHIALRFETAIAARQSAAAPATPPNAGSQAGSESTDVKRTQALLDIAGPVISATSSPTEIITATLALRPGGVRVDRITFLSGDKSALKIDGTSDGRESINQYKEALSKSGRFKSVSVPVDALVGAEGGKFTITLSGSL